MKKLMVLALAIVAVVAFSGVISAAEKAKKSVTFEFDFADFPKCKDFYVVGSFQGWATKVPKWKMAQKSGSVYTLTQDVKVGQHTYKYWSPQGTNGGWMIKDMQKFQNRIIAPAFEGATSDGFGGKNCILTVK